MIIFSFSIIVFLYTYLFLIIFGILCLFKPNPDLIDKTGIYIYSPATAIICFILFYPTMQGVNILLDDLKVIGVLISLFLGITLTASFVYYAYSEYPFVCRIMFLNYLILTFSSLKPYEAIKDKIIFQPFIEKLMYLDTSLILDFILVEILSVFVFIFWITFLFSPKKFKYFYTVVVKGEPVKIDPWI